MYSENLLSKKLKVFAERNEWLVSGEYIYGDEQGYLFSGMEGKGQKTFITPVPGIEESQVTELFAALEKNKTTMKLLEYDIKDDFLCVRIRDSVSLKPEDIEFILALLVGILQELTIVTAGRCQVCLELGAETENFVYDLYCYMHGSCVEKIAGEAGPVSQEPEASTSGDDAAAASAVSVPEDSRDVPLYKKILFTLGGAVLGSIPWLIMPYVMDLLLDLSARFDAPIFVDNLLQSLVTCICAYFVSYFAIVGYRLSSAKMDGKGRWIVGILSIVVVILVQFGYLAVLIVKEPDVALNFSNFITNLVKYNFYFTMLMGAGIGAVFTLISVLPFFDSSAGSDRAREAYLERRKRKEEEPSTDEEADADRRTEEPSAPEEDEDDDGGKDAPASNEVEHD